MTRSKSQTYSLEWYCRTCWQEGVYRTEGDAPPDGWPDPSKVAGVLKQHAQILRGRRCAGDLHPQQSKSAMKRIRHVASEKLPEPGLPLDITKRGNA